MVKDLGDFNKKQIVTTGQLGQGIFNTAGLVGVFPACND